MRVSDNAVIPVKEGIHTFTEVSMTTVRELIAQLPPDSQKRIAEMTKALIAEEKMLRESDKTLPQIKKEDAAIIESVAND